MMRERRRKIQETSIRTYIRKKRRRWWWGKKRQNTSHLSSICLFILKIY